MTFIILSAMFLQLLILISLIRPYSVQQRIHVLDERKTQSNQPVYQNEIEIIQSNTTGQRVCKKPNIFDLALLKNPIYYTYISMISFWALGLPQTFYFLPMYGRSINLSARENSLLLTYQSIHDFLCRIVIGFLLNKRIFQKRECFFVWWVDIMFVWLRVATLYLLI